ncbi:hypothetical protein AVEN_9042-1 [Araneus ventricosus]|uniref:Uncharacterized protein n=1 Tax=Araneus ventricosus TaxID=182803 RepID=A0A4Y2F8N0_ARAVE|nr:hypothetical protein AVEN_9042-1 [Araneus ventricosus]
MVNAIDNRTSSKSTYPFFQSRQRNCIGFFHLCKRRQVRIIGFRIHQESGTLHFFPVMGAFLRKRKKLLTPGGLIIGASIDSINSGGRGDGAPPRPCSIVASVQESIEVTQVDPEEPSRKSVSYRII